MILGDSTQCFDHFVPVLVRDQLVHACQLSGGLVGQIFDVRDGQLVELIELPHQRLAACWLDDHQQQHEPDRGSAEFPALLHPSSISAGTQAVKVCAVLSYVLYAQYMQPPAVGKESGGTGDLGVFAEHPWGRSPFIGTGCLPGPRFFDGSFRNEAG